MYRSPQADNGYDISDYEDIDPLFGTLDEFDALLVEVHRHGMKLVMDLVVNHSSDQHPWFEAAKLSRTCPKHDWYIWRDPVDGHEPNEWRAAFGGPAWSWDPGTGQYYLHMFTPQQPDLNWDNPDMRDAVYTMMNHWLDRGVDGFRMDVINHIAKDPAALADGSAAYVMQPRIHDHLQEMHERVFAGRDALLTVGEMPGVTVEDAVLFTDPERHELDMVFQFEHVGLDHGPSPSSTTSRSTWWRSRPRSRGGRPAWPTPGGTRCTWPTTTSRVRCPASAPLPSPPRTGSGPTPSTCATSRRPCSRRSCTCTAGRPTCTRATRSAC